MYIICIISVNDTRQQQKYVDNLSTSLNTCTQMDPKLFVQMCAGLLQEYRKKRNVT